MPKRNRLAGFGAISLLLLLICGLFYLAGLATSGSYPAFSSLNPDRLGAKLVYDALSQLPGLSVARNYTPIAQWRPQNTVILYLATSPDSLNAMDEKRLAYFERLAKDGNRVVFSLVEDEFELDTSAKDLPAIQRRWGTRLFDKPTGKDDETQLALETDSTWTQVSGLTDTWQKAIGSGFLVMSLHGEQFSNENIAANQIAHTLIPPLVSDSRSVVFEETHFGIEESGSIAGLIRRYKLEGFLLGLLLIVGLCIWNRSVSFPPPPQSDAEAANKLKGVDSRELMAGLLAKHLSAIDLLQSCTDEWNRLNARRPVQSLSQFKNDPLAGYRQIQEMLQAKRGKL